MLPYLRTCQRPLDRLSCHFSDSVSRKPVILRASKSHLLPYKWLLGPLTAHPSADRGVGGVEPPPSQHPVLASTPRTVESKSEELQTLSFISPRKPMLRMRSQNSSRRPTSFAIYSHCSAPGSQSFQSRRGRRPASTALEVKASQVLRASKIRLLPGFPQRSILQPQLQPGFFEPITCHSQQL